MYERFTDRARKVMQLANQEAQRFRHEYIGTEHILLGLIAEGSGVAANVLKNLDVDLEKVRVEVVKIIQHGAALRYELEIMGRLPHTPRTKKVIEYAIEEARDLEHNYVGTEHLLLGLVREQEGVGAQVLLHLGLTLDGIRDEVLNLLGHEVPGRLGRTQHSAPPQPDLKQNLLTPELREVFDELMGQITERNQAALAGKDYKTAMRYTQALLDLNVIMLRLHGLT